VRISMLVRAFPTHRISANGANNFLVGQNSLHALPTPALDCADHAQFVFSSLFVAGCPLRLRHRINNQEIPAVYVNGFLDNLVAYTGNDALPKSMI
jgi:hypothetical protein